MRTPIYSIYKPKSAPRESKRPWLAFWEEWFVPKEGWLTLNYTPQVPKRLRLTLWDVWFTVNNIIWKLKYSIYQLNDEIHVSMNEINVLVNEINRACKERPIRRYAQAVRRIAGTILKNFTTHVICNILCAQVMILLLLQ